MKQNPINHVAFAIDASGSMQFLTTEVVKAVDQQIADLAELSKQHDQETRVSVYTFADNVECIIYDQDVLRLASIASYYRPGGQTAMIDATLKAKEDLSCTATLYGDHAFLLFVFTDGQENASRRPARELQQLNKALPQNWTLACLVPNSAAKLKAMSFGFLPGNVAVWDASSQEGVREAQSTITQATANYMTARASGVKSMTGLFDMSATTVNHKTVSQLKEIVSGIEILPVSAPMDITSFITKQHKRTFRQGKYYFPLIKREKVGPQKNVVVRHKKSGKVYGGPEVRTLLGLPDHEVSIKPGINDLYDVFVQSTSTNRNLIPGHDLLVIE
jgi:von Willebrand factor type A domain-containing protein